MHPHVPLANLGSPGLPVSSYDQLCSRGRSDLPWPRDPRPRPGPGPRRGLLLPVGPYLRVRLRRPRLSTSA